MRQDASDSLSDFRNSPADSNVTGAYPNDSTMPPVAVRTDSSSSTIAIKGSVNTLLLCRYIGCGGSGKPLTKAAREMAYSLPELTKRSAVPSFRLAALQHFAL